MRKSTVYLALSGLLALGLGALFLHAGIARAARAGEIERTRRLAASLELTDLALFNEARYTRHLSQADLATAFQDHPVSLEHFPSGSVVNPPAIVRERGRP